MDLILWKKNIKNVDKNLSPQLTEQDTNNKTNIIYLL